MTSAAQYPIITPATEPGFLVVGNEPTAAELISGYCHQKVERERRFSEFQREEKFLSHHSRLELLRIQKSTGEARPQRAEANRLVTTRKSPTGANDRKTVARFYARQWSGEQRVSVESFTRLQDAPAPNVGDRWTEALTARAVRAIIDAGAYVATVREGFTTFLTLTFDDAARARILKVRALHQIEPGKPGQECGEHRAEGKFCHLPNAGDFCSGIRAAGRFSRVDFNTESTIGQEVSRFFDAMQKMYQRGWIWEPTQAEQEQCLFEMKPEKMPPRWDVRHSEFGPCRVPEKLDFIWVAENPDRWEYVTNYHGETCKSNTAAGTNPHVHVLMRWNVPRLYFQGWAERIEKLWGQGFAHLEKIRNPQAAGNYLLKALGYMTKGAHSFDPNTGELCINQGRIRGNRYNISASARAPGWECIAEFEAERMGQVVREIGLLQKKIQNEITEQLQQAREAQKTDRKRLSIMEKAARIRPEVKARHIARLQSRLNRWDSEVKALQNQKQSEAWGNAYKLTFRNAAQVQQFLQYAITARGWQAKAVDWAGKGKARCQALASWFESTGQRIRKAIESETLNRLKDWASLSYWVDYLKPSPPAKPEPWNGWEPVYCWE